MQQPFLCKSDKGKKEIVDGPTFFSIFMVTWIEIIKKKTIIIERVTELRSLVVRRSLRYERQPENEAEGRMRVRSGYCSAGYE